LHDLGVVLDFKEKTITIVEILLPMRNIDNLQLKTSISRALKLNTAKIMMKNNRSRLFGFVGFKTDQ